MNIFTYVVTRDFGFAPNPFCGICTLATCKPGIRKSAQIGDWIFGIGSKTTLENRMIYLMKVTNKITFDEYWSREEFAMKKPKMTTLKKMYGDNIYHYDNTDRKWKQENSHHSYENGEPNLHNLEKDTGSNNVLISDDFFYFGKSAMKIPKRYKVYRSIRGYCKKEITSNVIKFIDYVYREYEKGYNDDPILFTKFSRYDGVS